MLKKLRDILKKPLKLTLFTPLYGTYDKNNCILCIYLIRKRYDHKLINQVTQWRGVISGVSQGSPS